MRLFFFRPFIRYKSATYEFGKGDLREFDCVWLLMEASN